MFDKSSYYCKYDFTDIIGKNERILNAKHKALKVANTNSPVLIYGETGTGKELFVQAIHNNSCRRNKPFIAQNCAAIPNELFESVLFGTIKGSFTGAEARKGIFEAADGGTLYLDELNSMPVELQAKFLRTLQEGTIMRVGDSKIKKIDVRIISSVNENPEFLVEKGKLRKDLFYRLNVVRIDLPPLRERKEDIPVLVNYFIDKFNCKFKMNIKGIDKNVLEKFILREWHGNIRELEHDIEAAFNECDGDILHLNDFEKCKYGEFDNCENKGLKYDIMKFEKQKIKEALVICNNNISETAKYLCIPRQTLQYKIKKYNLFVKDIGDS
ncbi:arginine utilization regulatory protein RocR [Clostridium tepidiprofundi DSM 19306]|uniref:Arginine utilization regulatory protein RocR n=1 Tax=Clostridium tepidiprofundi DSM 19306 TaxID=1121338 RepID=A0A151B555_9CLOT|nr:sigma 54-interacting transcriptional regulator [Clostridium tepidiprofundi]KYH34933.1 arginine utilization regulatory protein RocR [Clostridium tepidiprofundi DSM 19306]